MKSKSTVTTYHDFIYCLLIQQFNYIHVMVPEQFIFGHILYLGK